MLRKEPWTPALHPLCGEPALAMLWGRGMATTFSLLVSFIIILFTFPSIKGNFFSAEPHQPSGISVLQN